MISKVVYTISIGSNEQRKENLSLARKRLKELFPGFFSSGIRPASRSIAFRQEVISAASSLEIKRAT